MELERYHDNVPQSREVAIHDVVTDNVREEVRPVLGVEKHQNVRARLDIVTEKVDDVIEVVCLRGEGVEDAQFERSYLGSGLSEHAS